jgi:hypothetical protein
MSPLSPKHANPEHSASAEIANQEDLDALLLAYEDFGIDQSLRLYALSGRNDSTLAPQIERSIDVFGQLVATKAVTDDVIDTGLVRAVFERFYDDMENAANAKYGPEKPYTLTGRILTHLGIRKPSYRQHFHRLDDKYWDKQFPDQFQKEMWVKRVDGESKQVYAGRYIATCLKLFPWANFTYI